MSILDKPTCCIDILKTNPIYIELSVSTIGTSETLQGSGRNTRKINSHMMLTSNLVRTCYSVASTFWTGIGTKHFLIR
ncbi:MAG: hypothetical protein ACXAAK_06825 [Candidatus Thorarchaeota archaeon]